MAIRIQGPKVVGFTSKTISAQKPKLEKAQALGVAGFRFLKQKSGPAFAALVILSLVVSTSGIKVSQATEHNNDNEDKNCGQPSVSLNVQNSEHEGDNDNEDCKVKVVINKVWQNADGQEVSAPEDKGDITITVAYGNNKTTDCTYVGDTLKCGKKIEVKAPSTIHITETSLPAGWEVVTSTIGDVLITDCSQNDTFTKHEGDDDDDNNKPTCTHTVINRMLPVDPCLNQIPVDTDHITHAFTANTDIALPHCAPKLHFIKVVCDAYSDVAGNKDADNTDDTNGHFTEFSNYKDGDFTPSPLVNGMVNPSEIPNDAGCNRVDGWHFKLDDNSGQESDDVQIVGPTVNGEFVTPISGIGTVLNQSNQNAIDHGQLWVSEVQKEGYDFAAIRCYKDALNGDNLEYISLGENRPNDIYCIAYNIHKSDTHPACLDTQSCITTIEGNKFEDVNGNHIWDDGEQGLAGWTITAYNHTTGDTIIDTEVTDANGHYLLTIPTNSDTEVVVSETQQAGWTQTAPTTGTPPGVWNLSLAAGGQQQLGGYNFGNMRHLTEPCGTELIVNGGFEAPVVTDGSGWDIFPSGTSSLGWTATWTTPTEGQPNPANVELHRGVNGWTSQGGSQHTELDSDWNGHVGDQNGEPANVMLSQTLTTVPGATYNISFYTSPRPGHSNNQMVFAWDGNDQPTISEDGSANGNTVWTLHTYSLIATGTSTSVSFREVGTGDSLGMLLDTVSVKQACSEICSEEKVNVNLISDSSTQNAGYTLTDPISDVEGLNATNYSGGGSFTNSVELVPPHPAWIDPTTSSSFAGSGAVWISTNSHHPGDEGGEGTGDDSQWRLFQKTFNVPAGATITPGTIYFSADNAVSVYLNGVLIDDTSEDLVTYGPNVAVPAVFNKVYSASFTPVVGNNTLSFVLRNSGVPGIGINPTGVLYTADFSYTPDCNPGGGDDGGGDDGGGDDDGCITNCTPPPGGGGGGSNGGGGCITNCFGGSSSTNGGGSTPDNGQVLGDSTGLPPTPQVLGETTELPRTGAGANSLMLLLLALIPLATLKRAEVSKQ